MFRRIALVLILLFSTFSVSGTSPVVSLAGQINNNPQAATAATLTTTGNIPALPLSVSISNNLIIYMNNASLATIQGMTAGSIGQRVTIFSIGAGQVDLSNLDAAASVGLKLLNYVQSGVTSLAAGVGSAEFVYDSSSRWRLINHFQGDYITWAPSFTTSGAPTWTAQSTSASKYYLTGRQLSLIFEYNTSTVSAPVNELRFTLPSTLTSSTRAFQSIRIVNNGAAAAMGSVLANATDQFCRLYVDLTDASNWAAGVTNNSVRGEITAIVQ